MLTKSRKIRLYPSREQRVIFRKWFGAARFVYNKTIEYLKQPGTKASWMSLKGEMLSGLPEWCGEVPYQIKSIAVRDACWAVREAKRKCMQGKGFSRVAFRSRKAPVQSCFIPKTAVCASGIYPRIAGLLSYREPLPDVPLDSRLICHGGRYSLSVPSVCQTTRAENQGRVVALDPGVRTFLTWFAEGSCGKLGKQCVGRIQRLCHHLDGLIGRSTRAKAKQGRRMRLAADRLRHKIRDLVDDLHWKCARFLCESFDVILLPTFEVQGMCRKARRKLRRKSVRQMLTLSHFKFKQRLRHKALELGKVVLDVCEAYTSKTASWTGEMVNVGGRKTIKSQGKVLDRDVNGARGIFLRALADSPALRAQLAPGVRC